MSDHPPPWPLAERSGLPRELSDLAQPSPRARSTDANLSDLARFWLQMHDGFRREAALMRAAGSDLHAGRIDARAYHDLALPVLAGFLQHLDGHHHVESGHYFPVFRRLDDRLPAAIDMLDRDHDAILAHLEALAGAGRTLHRAIREAALDGPDLASRLADVIAAAETPLLRHLEDEEDLIVPILMRSDVL